MKGKLIIGESSDYVLSQTAICEDIEPYGFEVTINTPLDEDFISLISNPYDFDETIKINMEIQDDNLESLKFLEDFKNDRVQYLKNVEYIVFRESPREIADYIKKNPILQAKKIVFEIGLDLDPKYVNDIYEAFDSNTSNIFFDVVGNSSLITFSEYKATVDAINKMVNEIEKFNFSPLEKIMYSYDIVRNKLYVEVDENEDKMISRNLSSSLLGDKIVCVGYAVIFKTLLRMLGIECHKIHLFRSDGKSGHARNLIHVKDKKYNIDGVYYFDPTWDRKRKENDNEYLYSYKYFAITKKTIEEIDKGYFVEDGMPYPVNSILSEFETSFDKYGWYKVPKNIINQINYMSHLVGEDTIIHSIFIYQLAHAELMPTKEQVMEKFTTVLERYNNPISADIMLQVLYNVRKVQFYTMPEKFPFGVDEFFRTMWTSNWDFMETPQKNLIKDSTHRKVSEHIQLLQFAKYTQTTNLQRKIDEIKLTSVLRNEYEEKAKKNR